MGVGAAHGRWPHPGQAAACAARHASNLSCLLVGPAFRIALKMNLQNCWMFALPNQAQDRPCCAPCRQARLLINAHPPVLVFLPSPDHLSFETAFYKVCFLCSSWHEQPAAMLVAILLVLKFLPLPSCPFQPGLTHTALLLKPSHFPHLPLGFSRYPVFSQ